MRPTTSVGLVPLADRMRALVAVRLVLTGGVAVLAPELAGGAVAVGALSVAIEVARRRSRRPALLVVSGLLLLDGLALVVALAATGLGSSPLVVALHLHVMAATLLVGTRSGLKVAVWDVLLLAGALTVLEVVDGPAVAEAVTARTATAGAACLLVAVGAAAGSSVNERLLRRSQATLSGLVDLGHDLERARVADDVLDVLRTHLVQRLGACRAAVALVGDEPLSGSLGRCADHRARVLVGRPEADDGALLDLLPAPVNAVLVPLVADDEVLGVAVVEVGAARTVAAADVAAMEDAAGRAAQALRTATLLAEVERLARLDALTGLANRRAFDEVLRCEVERAQRLGTALGLVVLDVDHFKAVNDQFGHQAGDDVLRQVGVALGAGCRAADLACRYGGEEFVVLAPGASAADAVATAERLRSAIADGVTATSVTASAGVAMLGDHALDAHTLVAAADAALYEAKLAGRDRTVASRRRARPLVAARAS